MVPHDGRSDREIPIISRRVIHKKIRRTHMQRMKRDVLCLFTHENVFLHPDLVFLVLEFANLVHVGNRLLCFTVFFPRLIKRRHEPLDDRRDENVPPQ